MSIKFSEGMVLDVEMLNYVEYLNEHLNIPTKAVIVLVFIFLVLQVIGELLEFKGKVVPEFLKIRKYFKRRREEREETFKALQDVKKLLDDVNQHYSNDNIQKRNSWMQWVNDRADVYDTSIVDISNKIDDIVQALKCNTRMTEEMFVQSSRDRIIDFATKVGDKNIVVSREEFNRIFKVYEKYEKFLEDHGLTNGEVDIAMHIIKESYEQRIITHNFIEDIRGYNN